MYSDNGSSNGSLSDDSDVSVDVWSGRQAQPPMPRRKRTISVTSVCSHPEEDAYVMVLQNKVGTFKDLRNVLNSKELCDVTFLVGKDRIPVYGIRAIISTHCRALYDEITEYEQSHPEQKQSRIKSIKKKLSKMKPLKTTPPKVPRPIQLSEGTGSDVTKKVTLPIPDFDSECFKRLMTYVHCGTLTVDAQNVIGLLNASNVYSFPEVRKACWDFVYGCTAREDNLQDLFDSVQKYSNTKTTQALMKEVVQYMDDYPELSAHSPSVDKIAQQFKMTDEVTVAL